jgi:triacylglycerol esterase/lipase EstA (alpha/beta hydrolase family)
MDPLSVVAGLSGIISLTGQLARRIIEVCEIYIHQGSDSSEEIVLLHHETSSLRLVLEEFGDLSHVSSTTVLSIPRALASEIANCPPDLTALKEKIDPGRRQSAKSDTGFGGLQWPLTRDELERTTKDIERYRLLLRLALQAEQRYVS